MSNPERIYLAPECHEEGERLWCEDDVWASCHEHDGEHCEESHPSVRYVRSDVHDALAQRCRELEHRCGALGLELENSAERKAQAERTADTLRAERAQLERIARHLVRVYVVDDQSYAPETATDIALARYKEQFK